MVLSTIGDPKLVILDEVTTGLDPVSMHPALKIGVNGRYERLLELHRVFQERAVNHVGNPFDGGSRVLSPFLDED